MLRALGALVEEILPAFEKGVSPIEFKKRMVVFWRAVAVVLQDD